LSDSSYSNCVLWKITKECYNQATSCSGVLYPDNYFIERNEACLEWLYNPDFEAKEYYKYEDCLAIDNDYTKAIEE